ncbi:ChbG/HpnK family deacetylase [Veillonella agrestimuris]|uniref:ChbG/HpnK family deacetylase n=1 Tax=Veillonella agrestimuris TaxID=2941340 RepID=UPI00203C8C84|nr:ChbG/HpnK family deacetylase [Veillonella agrestimuris]
MSKLIINADDFGLHSAVNAGIIDGHLTGVITSTSLLATGHAFNEAVAMAKEHDTLGIGVHIALVGGLSPVSDPKEVPSLVTKDGVFVDNYIEFMKRLYKGDINYSEVRLEISRQIEKIVNTGLRITHVDGHQHMHILPTILPIVMEEALTNHIKAMRIPNERGLFINGVYNPFRMVGKLGLSSIAEQAMSTVRQKGIHINQYFWGMINGGQLTEIALIRILKEVKDYPGIHEIMTHPGIDNTMLNRIYNWNYHWKEELEALTSDHVRRYILQHDIELINYGDLQ